jgi:Xaa-Pro dipeptidase
MRPEIIALQRQIIAANGLHALIAVSPENFAWTAGFVVPSQPILRWRHAIVVVKADGTYAVVCVDMEETTVRNRLPGVELRVWGEFEFNAMQTLAGLLSDMGLGAARIGIEMDYLPAGDYLALRKALPAGR